MKVLCWFALKFVLVQEWFDLRCGPAVDAERFVICTGCCTFGPERRVLKEDARAWVLLPVEGYVGVALTVHLVTFQSVAWFRVDMREVVKVLRSLVCFSIRCSLFNSLSACSFSASVSYALVSSLRSSKMSFSGG